MLRSVLAFLVALFACAAHAGEYQLRRATFTAPIYLDPWEPEYPGLHGTGVWSIDFQATTNGYVQVDGNTMIRHSGVVLTWTNQFGATVTDANYPIYANCRVHLIGPSATPLPANNWSPPADSTMIMINGWNIFGESDHYANASLRTPKISIVSGYYRVQVFCSAGSGIDISRAGLAYLVPYNAPLHTWFSIEVTP